MTWHRLCKNVLLGCRRNVMMFLNWSRVSFLMSDGGEEILIIQS